MQTLWLVGPKASFSRDEPHTYRADDRTLLGQARDAIACPVAT